MKIVKYNDGSVVSLLPTPKQEKQEVENIPLSTVKDIGWMGNLFAGTKQATAESLNTDSTKTGYTNHKENRCGGGLGITTIGYVNKIDSNTMQKATENFITNKNIQAVTDPDLDIIMKIMEKMGIPDIETLAASDSQILSSACTEYFRANRVSFARTGAVSQMRKELTKMGFLSADNEGINDFQF